MKKIILILFLSLMTLTVWADGKYLFFWADESMRKSDKEKLKIKIKNRLHDITQINFGDLPEWRPASNKSKIGRVLCIDVKGKKLDFTKTEAESWRDANLSEPWKLQWMTGDSVKVLYEAGFEPIWLISINVSTNNVYTSK